MTRYHFYKIILLLLLVNTSMQLAAQEKKSFDKVKKASKKIERGFQTENKDTLAQGYFELGESFYQKGELQKSEEYYQKSKDLYEKVPDAEGVAKSSRALAKVQEDLNKNKEAVGNYNTARLNNIKTGDVNSNLLNTNDAGRLNAADSTRERLLQENIKLGLKNKDTTEIISSYSRAGTYSLQTNNPNGAVGAFQNAYKYSVNLPVQQQMYNQAITDVYLKQKDFSKAIATKKEIFKEGFVQQSTQIKAKEIVSLADIYIQKNESDEAMRLLNESYELSVRNGHTIEAKECIEKLDSIFSSTGQKDQRLALYKRFLAELPSVIRKDSSLTDNRLVAETEMKIKELETEKALKDDLIRRKNIFNYWLTGSVIALVFFIAFILYILRKLRIKNKKIALQSLRREMNPHFIFNSLNSINQFISNNNELAANQYLTKFSTLMRRVMENSKEDFVLFAKELELLQHYLELEKSRFPDKFDFDVKIDEELLVDEQLYIPGMLVQPHLENAVWHGLRYMDEKGLLQLSFTKLGQSIAIVIEDNGIGIAESKKNKTVNQKKHSGRGITNTFERIKILNELYHENITCTVEDKQTPGHGVKVKIIVPLLKTIKHEN
ncbi:MAG: histidine kinase [Ferruginibacter sp.]